MIQAHLILALHLLGLGAGAAPAEPLPGTTPLRTKGDLAAQMVDGINKYLTHELAAAIANRPARWRLDHASAEAYQRSVQPNRDRLRRMLGVVDKRLAVTELEFDATTTTAALVADGEGYRVFAVRWPVLEGVDAAGLWLEPKGMVLACVVALPDADWSPEMLVGLAPGVAKESQFARRLAENGCRVLVPTLIDRKDSWSGNPKVRMTNQPHREFIHRMAYEMGRHIIGYEVQKVLAAVDWFTRSSDHPPVGVFGYGEGGLLALYSAAVDPRIQATAVSGYFGPHAQLAEEPIYRNAWGLLREFGDAEVALLIPPRALVVEASKGPEVTGPPPAHGLAVAAPGRLVAVDEKAVLAELDRAALEYSGMSKLRRTGLRLRPVTSKGTVGSEEALMAFLKELTPVTRLIPTGRVPKDRRPAFDPSPRLRRQFDQLVGFTQRLARASESRRHRFWARADSSSPEKWQASCESYRNYLWEEVFGKLPVPTLPANPRTRLAYDQPKWKGYEVLLDLYPDVFACGVLLVPRDIKPGERRPVVVCQHGLEGRPNDVVNPRKKTVYNSFGAQLADRGFVVYAPQNPYIFGNKFRQLQRKAQPLKLSLFSFILRQHERTLDWLAGLPFVDPKRIGFYGLSYGGETAVRVPSILKSYALSICSGDFNQFVWKCTTLDFAASYMLVGTYEIFDFDLGNTFSHAEMAYLVAPRPFMVERGHDDGVGVDEWVAYEYAKVRRLYAKLGLSDRTGIEFFPGGHMIHGRGTFAFLEKHLHWGR